MQFCVDIRGVAPVVGSEGEVMSMINERARFGRETARSSV